MRPEIVSLRENAVDAASPAVRKAVDALRSGQLCVFPTETVYGLGALASNADAVRRLLEAKGRPVGRPLALAISGPEELARYIPNAGILANRLARRLWPGPLTLVLNVDDGSAQSELLDLPELSIQAIKPEKTVGFRVPRNEFLLNVLRELGEPIVLTSANLSGEPPATCATAAKVGLDDRPDLIFDDGEAAFGEPSTVVEVDGFATKILREGTISAARFRQFCAKVVVFVCTGNTCRSPMAEIVAKKLAAERLGCSVDELSERGLLILSAGVAAFDGAPASANARQVVRADYAASLDEHGATSFGPELARIADVVLTLGGSHRRAVLSAFPELSGRVENLRLDGGDVADPFGASEEVYRRCAKQIEAEIRARLENIVDLER